MLKTTIGALLSLGGLALVGVAFLATGLHLLPFAYGAVATFVGLLLVWLGGGLLSELD